MIFKAELLRVVSFEFDTHFSFSYVGYPECSIISQKHWSDTVHIDIHEENDLENIAAVFERNGYVEEDEGGENQSTGNYIEE